MYSPAIFLIILLNPLRAKPVRKDINSSARIASASDNLCITLAGHDDQTIVTSVECGGLVTSWDVPTAANSAIIIDVLNRCLLADEWEGGLLRVSPAHRRFSGRSRLRCCTRQRQLAQRMQQGLPLVTNSNVPRLYRSGASGHIPLRRDLCTTTVRCV
jgi:hypothetical protein